MVSCVKQPKVTDANNYLLIQKELIKLSSYGDDLKSNKDSLTSVPDVYDQFMIKPKSRIDDLTLFLENNDCLLLTEDEKDLCYRRTRLMLIQATKGLDEAESRIYYLNRSVSTLRGNLNSVITNYPEIKY